MGKLKGISPRYTTPPETNYLPPSRSIALTAPVTALGAIKKAAINRINWKGQTHAILIKQIAQQIIPPPPWSAGQDWDPLITYLGKHVMKKNSEVIRQIIIIAVIGLALTFFRGEYSWSFSLDSLQGADLETILSYLNQGLPILAMFLGIGVIVYLRIRASSGERSSWNSEEDDS